MYLLMASLVRLYVDQPLGAGQVVVVTRQQAHYLFGVMRLSVGAELRLFNDQDGEWAATVSEAGKRGGVLTCNTQTKPHSLPPDVWLMFAPVKKSCTDFIVEKAVELGARRICPVLTDYTNSERVRVDRLQAHAIEAAEQSGGTYVPPVAEPAKLGNILDNWDKPRRLLFCDETALGSATDFTSLTTRDDAGHGPWAILIGPEGGFSGAERKRLHALPFAHTISLGPRILRAETAAVAALTLWQAKLGDWV